MRWRRRAGAISALLVLTALPAAALDPHLAITQYAHQVWRAPASLPHDDVTAILQTRDGYLWVGTVEGLARFDGVRSVVFDKSNTAAFSDNWIRALLEDRSGRLWIGTLGGGLVCLENGRFTRIAASQGMSGQIVTALLADRSGRLWVGTSDQGLFRQQGDRFERAPGTEDLASRSIRSLAEDNQGALWIGTETGLFRSDQGRTTRLPAESGLTSETILALAVDGTTLWIGTETGGLNRLADGKITSFGVREGLPHQRVWSLAVDRDGNLWIGTDGGGLARLRDGKISTFDTHKGLTNDFVWALREDREGSLWVGTNGGGLNQLKNGNVVMMGASEGLPGDFIWSVLRDRQDNLWIGTEDAGLARLRDGKVTTYSAPQGLSGSVRAILERADGSLWLGGDRGIFALEAGRVRRVQLDGTPLGIVQALAEDGAGTLWIGTVSQGLRSFDGNQLRTWTPAEGLLGNSITALLPANDGALWIGMIGGIQRREADGRWSTSLTQSEGLPSSFVTALFEDERDVLWAATRGGLARVQDGRVASLTAAQGLFDDALMSALPGDDGAIWMGSNRGLFASPRSEIEAVMAGRRTRVSSRSFGLEDGLRSVEVNHSGSSRFKDRDGRLYFATRRGVATVDPVRLRTNPVPPPVVIEEVVADDRTLPAGGSWKLPAGTRRLDFHFTALSFRSVPGTLVLHRLEGFDPDWVRSKPDRTASYTSLPHGGYRFRVIATNGDGVWNREGASMEFEIAPRIYETLWFRGLLVLVFAVAGPFFYFARVRQLRQRQAQLERLVTDRTAEVEAANSRLAQLANEDGLTGVANRRRLDETLHEEWRRALRLGTPLAVLLIDVDLFKDYNDRLGHLAGDTCLKEIATSVSETCRRAGEFVARFGGEEFAVVLPGASQADALSVAEKVRAAVEALELEHPTSSVAPVVTVSVGVAWSAAKTPSTATDLLDAADRSLYRAKRDGRNRVDRSNSD